MKAKHCIFISVDKNFINHLKVCLLSIKKNYKNCPDIIICYTNITQRDIESLQKILPIIPLQNTVQEEELGPIMDHLPAHIDPKVFYARLLIRRHLLFRRYDNILHLDADTIILKNCENIFEKTSFYIEQEAYTGDDQIFFDIHDINLQEQLLKDNISLNNQAGNAGVFMTPKKYNNDTTYNELVYILTHYKKRIKWADQSVIAIWLSKQGINVQKQHIYNFQHRHVEKPEFDDTFAQAKIIHFNGVHPSYRLVCMKIGLHLFGSAQGRKIYRYMYRWLTSFYNR